MTLPVESVRHRRPVRHHRFVAVAALVAIGATALVVPSVPAPAGATESGATETVATAATPVFSARRVPALVQSVAAEPALRTALDAVIAASPAATCLAVDVAGRPLYRTGIDEPLIPASNQKVLTAQLALDVLGPDHRFGTEVAGDLGDDGVVAGDLYLVGGGDPVLRTAAYQAYFGDNAGEHTSLEVLADRVVAEGVDHITGSVIGDESRYDTLRSVPDWPGRYLDQHQLGPLSALEVNQSFTWFPDTYSEEGLAQLEAAAEPAQFAAHTFADLLAERGVRIDGQPGAGVRPAGAPTIATATSPPLSEIIAQLLNRSDNQIAELLVKEAGVTEGGAGSTEAGLTVFADTLAGSTLPDEGVQMRDGSGLDYDDRLTCELLHSLLERAGPDSAIADGLAIGGQTGTLEERFTDPATKGRIRAKTGSLNEVTSLSGFAEPGDAPPLSFAYIANGAPVTAELLGVQEELGRALVAYGEPVPLSELEPR